MTDQGIIAARDPYGFRPLCLGRFRDAWIVASESCAFDLLDAEYVREIEPGELVVLDHQGVTSYKPFVPTKPAMCVFEYVYFSRPDSHFLEAAQLFHPQSVRGAIGSRIHGGGGHRHSGAGFWRAGGVGIFRRFGHWLRDRTHSESLRWTDLYRT